MFSDLDKTALYSPFTYLDSQDKRSPQACLVVRLAEHRLAIYSQACLATGFTHCSDKALEQACLGDTIRRA